MRMPLGAVPSTCGSDPCGAWDYVWVSDECQNYLACAGLPAMTFGAQFAAGLHNVGTGTANAIAAGTTGLFSNPLTTVLLIGVGLIAVAYLVKK